MKDAPEEVVNATTDPIFPHVKVRLVGEDSNAFSIMARVAKALKKAGVRQEVIDYYYEESQSGDYDHLLATAIRFISVAPPMVCGGCGEIEDDCRCLKDEYNDLEFDYFDDDYDE